MNGCIWWLYLCAPVLLFFCGVMMKIIIRGGGPWWNPHDWYVGLDLTFLAFSSGLLHLIELLKTKITTVDSQQKMLFAGLFVVLTAAMLFFEVMLHQRLQSDAHGTPIKPGKAQVLVLGFVANGIGLGLFLGFLLLVKGV